MPWVRASTIVVAVPDVARSGRIQGRGVQAPCKTLGIMPHQRPFAKLDGQPASHQLGRAHSGCAGVDSLRLQ
eukprot:scaffold113305_cov40-Tisochrysis_lutea.AAC.1